MKKLTLIAAVLLIFSACDSTPGGNKSIQPVHGKSHHGDEHHSAANHESEEAHGEEHGATTEENHNEKSVDAQKVIDATKLTFTAYKTPDRVGVSGTFDEIKITNEVSGSTSSEVFNGLNFEVNKISHNTGDPTRDQTLKNEFFSKLAGKISGSFGEAKDGKIPVTLNLNDKETTKEFDFFVSDDNPRKAVIQGKIDLLEDFGATTAFESIALACKALHLNKTWTDVDIKVETDLSH